MDIPLSISPEDWQATPPAVQALVGAQAEKIRVLEEELQRLREDVAALREQVGQNSTNSSRPPSSDPPETAAPPRPSSGRKPGGQPGHPGVSRMLKPLTEVQEVIPVKPEQCAHCGQTVAGEDADPQRHQVTEIPPVVAETVEYQLHMLTCPDCGTQTRAELPEGVPRGAFGPRVQALVAGMSGQYRLSKRQIEAILADCFAVELGLGSVTALEQATRAALQEPVEEAQAAVQEEEVANADETSWREGTKRGWLWVAVTAVATVFLIRLSRGGKVAQELLGENFGGVVGSDRWSGYQWLNPARRQLCWAHLLRNFEAWIQRGGESQRIGTALQEQAQRMFSWWHRIRDGTLSRAEFQEKMAAVQERVGVLLRAGATCDHPKTAGTCRNILALEKALWTFVGVEGVEPTNNAAERAIRAGVLWRKGSFGTQSADGSRFVERMMTVVATLKQQRRNVLDYLTAVCEASLRGEKAPSLLAPTTPAS